MQPAAAAPPAPLFDAVLYPSRSLPPMGFVLLMTAVVLVSVLVGSGFVLVGAWPVTGFIGLDVVLLYLAFRWNYRQAQRAEFIRLDKEGLVVRKIEPGGRSREWRFEPYWVRVALDRATHGPGRLYLTSHGQWLQIGAFLSAEERVDVADALRAALHAHRSGS
ncbi:MAG: DUF2244 domain-containing protein [Geminicoccaceae bacterium]|nr:DUF2244 domain-containing protein [Geminicoccaceae bacterium]